MMKTVYTTVAATVTVALCFVFPRYISGDIDLCVDCLPKSWSHTPPDDECIDLLDKTYCGRWGISQLYYTDCQMKANTKDEDFRACTTNVTCARDCVLKYLDRYTRNCRIQLKMAVTDVIGCREYTAIHSGGPYGCQNIGTDTDIRDRIDNMSVSVVCLALMESPTSTAAPIQLRVILPATIIPVVVILVIVLLAATVLRKRKMRSEEYAGFLGLMKGSAKLGIINASDLSDDVKQLLTTRALPKSAIEIEQKIGSGHFGDIYMGTILIESEFQKTVAVKKLKSHSFTISDAQHFLSEALIMASFDHENVLGLIGVCWEEGESPLIIMPYMGKGDLLTLIKSDSPKFSMADIIHFSLQIAEGMRYLSSKKFIHRDLAARNCLVSDYFLVKISDFGLSRDVYETNYYIVEEGRLKPLPWKWMALESIKEGKFSTQSDVWSFGIVLWELFTYGSTPYPGVGNLDELETYLAAGARLAQPEKCPAEMFLLMKLCWREIPSERPHFLAVVETMQQFIKLHHNDAQYQYTCNFGERQPRFSTVGAYVRQPCEVSKYAAGCDGFYVDNRNSLLSLNSSITETSSDSRLELKNAISTRSFDVASEYSKSTEAIPVAVITEEEYLSCEPAFSGLQPTNTGYINETGRQLLLAQSVQSESPMYIRSTGADDKMVDERMLDKPNIRCDEDKASLANVKGNVNSLLARCDTDEMSHSALTVTKSQSREPVAIEKCPSETLRIDHDIVHRRPIPQPRSN